MKSLLRVITLRHLGRDRLRFFLTLSGIALGVAVLTAIRTTNVTILGSFRSTVQTISGRSDLEIHAPEQGLDEEVFRIVRHVPGIFAAAPLVEVRAGIPSLTDETLIILGVDLLSDETFRPYAVSGTRLRRTALRLITEPTAVLVSRDLAKRLRLSEGSSLDVILDERRVHLVVRGFLESSGLGSAMAGRVAVMDIAAAQWTFGRLGRLDRIDLRLRPGISAERVIETLRPLLPGDVRVLRPEDRNSQAERMLRAFQLNLTALSGISLFVGAFLIYNTVSTAVVRRRQEIGILRSLGASRKQIIALFEAEAFLLGMSGSAVGIGLGLLLSRLLLKTVTQAVTANYLLVAVSNLSIRPDILIQSALLGIGVSLLACLVPVLEAGRIAPREALQSQSFEVRQAAGIHRTILAGCVSLSLAAGCAFAPPIDHFPLFGFLAAFFLLLGVALLSPAAVLASGRWIPRLPGIRRHPERRVAAETLALTPGRSSVTVSAIMIGTALLVSIGIMIGSFRKTVTIWVDQTMTADLLVVSPAGLFQGADAAFPDSFERLAERVPGVAAINAVRLTRIVVDGDPIILGAGNLAVHRRYGRFLPVHGDSDSMITGALSSEGVIVSEGFARRRGLKTGKTLLLDTPRGPHPFTIAGVVFDYASDRGKIFMDRRLYTRHWGDPRLTVLDVYRDPAVPLETLRRRLEEQFSGDHHLDVITHEELKRGVLDIFDQTFAVTSALQGIAVIVSVLGIANTLLASILERRREIGTLRAVGASRRQVGRLFLFEAGYLGLLGILLGIAAGLALSVILIYVINRQSFNWTIQYVFEYTTLLQAAAVILGASLAAGLLPARRAARLPVGESLQYE